MLPNPHSASSYIILRIFNLSNCNSCHHEDTGCPTRYKTRHFFNNFTNNDDIATTTDTHYRHTLQTHTTDTRYRHTTDTHTTDTHYRHTLQTHTTDTHFKHTLQTHVTDTHYRHTLQTHTTDTHHRHTLQTHTTDTFLFICHAPNVLLFKFRCNIFIGGRIIKEMLGSVASGTHCTTRQSSTRHSFYIQWYICQGDMFRPSRLSSGPPT